MVCFAFLPRAFLAWQVDFRSASVAHHNPVSKTLSLQLEEELQWEMRDTLEADHWVLLGNEGDED